MRPRLLLGRSHLAPQRRGFRSHHAVERAVRVALAGLMVERQDDLALHVAAVIVMLEMRRADPESDEHQRRAGLTAGADPLRIELLADREMARRALAAITSSRLPSPSVAVIRLYG